MQYCEEIIKEIEKLLEEGNTRRTAYECVGIAPQTFFEWMAGKVPEKALENCKTEEEREKKKAEFSERVNKALGKGKRLHIGNIARCGIGIRKEITKTLPDGTQVRELGDFIREPDWRASAELLKMTHKDEFAERKEYTGPEGKPIEVRNADRNQVNAITSDPEAARLASELCRQLQSGTDASDGSGEADKS